MTWAFWWMMVKSSVYLTEHGLTGTDPTILLMDFKLKKNTNIIRHWLPRIWFKTPGSNEKVGKVMWRWAGKDIALPARRVGWPYRTDPTRVRVVPESDGECLGWDVYVQRWEPSTTILAAGGVCLPSSNTSRGQETIFYYIIWNLILQHHNNVCLVLQ